jgi:hypothetical protein
VEDERLVSRLQHRVKGLEDEVKRIDAKLDVALGELQAALDAWDRAEIKHAIERAQAKAARFVTEIAPDLAIGRVHRSTTLDAMMRYAQLTTLGTGRDLFFPVSSNAWRDNPAMVEITAQHEAIIQAVNAVLRERRN